jgi:general secretion pathway protein G
MKMIIRAILIFMVIGTSVAWIYYNYFKSEGGHHFDATRAQLGLFKTSLSWYKLDNGAYPAGLVYLWGCPSDDKGKWQGPYMDGDEIPPDPWGRSFKYELLDRGQRCKITSAGTDGLFGTPDDKYMEYMEHND